MDVLEERMVAGGHVQVEGGDRELIPEVVEMMHVLVTAVEERMEVDIKEVRQDAGERFYWQDHQLTADSVGGPG